MGIELSVDNDLKHRAKIFAIEVIRFVRTLPVGKDYDIIGRQLIRSATSVGSNCRAAFRGRSKKEFIAKLGIVVEEANECSFWLEIIDELNQTEKSTKLLKESNELTAIFNSIKSKQ